MEFASVSGRWSAEDYGGGPEELIRALAEKVIAQLPEDALGHVKGFAEFDGGEVYVSSTLVPEGINLLAKGEFKGGAITANMVLLFAGLSGGALERALELGRLQAQVSLGCRLVEKKRGENCE